MDMPSEMLEEEGYQELAMKLNAIRTKLKEMKDSKGSDDRMEKLTEKVGELQTILTRKAVFEEE